MHSAPKSPASVVPPFASGPFPATILAGDGHGESGNCGHFLAPLAEFYDLLPELPKIEAKLVPADSLPQPQQALLAHFGDMTSTLT